jgi:beta-glucosidase
MTDEERFSTLVSVMGTSDVVTERDNRIPEGNPMSADYAPHDSSTWSLGTTYERRQPRGHNPGYREGDSATALPAGVALGASVNPARSDDSWPDSTLRSRNGTSPVEPTTSPGTKWQTTG